MGRELYADTEGDGLLPELTVMWCLGAIDMQTREALYFGPPVPPDHPLATPTLCNPAGTVEEGWAFLSEADLVVGHNWLDYDRRAIKKLNPTWRQPKKEWDSLVVAKVLWPYDALIGPDMSAIQAGRLPAKFLKSHSLKAWGYRLGERKDEYEAGFDKWSPEMAAYMMQDCKAGLALWDRCKLRLGWTDASPSTFVWPELVLDIEHGAHEIILQQETDGVHFNVDKAVELSRQLTNAQAQVGASLREQFGEWWQPIDDPAKGKPFKKTLNRKMTELVEAGVAAEVTIPRVGAKGQPLKPYIGPPIESQDEGCPWVRIEWTQLNPGSRDHLTNRLMKVYGWQPKAFGKDGKPKLDETTIEEIPDHILPRAVREQMLQYFKLTKTLGMLSVGNKSWLKVIDKSPDGRMHGRMDTCGAITARGIHKDPNLGQVPAVITKKDEHGVAHPVKGIEGGFGYECRELFEADPGWEQTGVDATALELIDLGHYLYPLDDGAFSARVCDPLRDAHTEHSAITGLSRSDTKTCTYLYVYGGSAWKLTFEIEVTEEEIPALLGYKGLSGLLRNLEKRFGPDYVARYDDKAKALLSKARQIILKFEAGITGIKDLKADVTEAARRGYVKGMDGRKLFTMRKPHAALNTLLQGAGAISCKLWMVLVHRNMRKAGYVYGKDWKQVLFIHDELQTTHRPGLGPDIARIAEESLVEAGEILGLRGRYRSAAKTGLNWAMCH